MVTLFLILPEPKVNGEKNISQDRLPPLPALLRHLESEVPPWLPGHGVSFQKPAGAGSEVGLREALFVVQVCAPSIQCRHKKQGKLTGLTVVSNTSLLRLHIFFWVRTTLMLD
jgi:hypothetical protein